MKESKNSSITARIVTRYRFTASITVGAVILLIFVGGIVRSTGSGLGCPDWPKCFGQWVPPTDVSELPADYKTRFKVAGKEIADFDTFKTWVEYLNRLLGVVIGFLALLTAGFSWSFRQIDKRVTGLSIAALFLTIVQGGIGAIVVKTHLATWMVTLHMAIALVILGLLIAALMWSYKDRLLEGYQARTDLAPILWITGLIVLAFTLIQVALGTQVREQVDQVAIAMGEGQRLEWIGQLKGVYDIHKVFYYSIAASLLFWVIKLKPYYPGMPALKVMAGIMVGVLLGEVLLGLAMHYAGILPVLQPFHLLLATLLFSAEFVSLGILYFMWRAPETASHAPREKVLG